MPRTCLTKYFLEDLRNQDLTGHITHYYDEDIPGFMLEYRGKWRGTWYLRYRDANKKLRYYRIGSLHKMLLVDARSKAYTLHELTTKGIDIKKQDHPLQTSICLASFVHSYYMPHARIKKRSWDLDERILRLHILPHFEHYNINKILRSDILSWQNGLRIKGLGPNTCNRTFILFKTILNRAIQWGVIPTSCNPCQGVTPFEVPPSKERYLTSDEARRLLDALHLSLPQRSAQVIQLLLFTGARKNEILSARWEHVDMHLRLLTVPLSKSGKKRYIPLSDEAVSIIQSITRLEGNPWVFPGKGRKGHLQSVFRLWQKLRNQLGLEGVRLHDLRHSFASFLVNAGCSLYEVQCCLGHHDPKVTMRYAHLTPQALVQAANMVGKAIQHTPTGT